MRAMKPIATPAWTLTADSIRTSFQLSHKRHFFLTGSRGAGKTTLLTQLFPDLSGLTTWVKPQCAVYLRENSTGATAQIGIFDASLPGSENRMRLHEEGFLRLGIAALARCAQSTDEWISIDEIGYLEETCPAYQTALLDIMDKKRIAAVIRKQDLPFSRTLLSREDAFILDLDAPLAPLSCVIMASGLGQRFGGNKLMASFHGAPLLERALHVTDGIFVDRVVVTRHTDVAALCEIRGIRYILHELPGRNDTVRLGLDALCASIGCLFCPGDQPLLRRDTVLSLALCASHSPGFIYRAAHGDTVGSPVLFPQCMFDELRHLPEGKGGGVIAKKYPALVRHVPVRDASELRDVDTPGDLLALEALES